MAEIRLTRVYDHESTHGRAFLVERLWPRGVRREDVRLDGWCKDVAPSTELRKWFGHDPAKWEEFRGRYIAELDAYPGGWQPLADAAGEGTLTLLYSSRDRAGHATYRERQRTEPQCKEHRPNPQRAGSTYADVLRHQMRSQRGRN